MKDKDSTCNCLQLQNWVSRVRRTGCAVSGSISGFPWGVGGWCSSHVSDTAEKNLGQCQSWIKQTCRNLIDLQCHPGPASFCKLAGWGLGDPAAGKVGAVFSWCFWMLLLMGFPACLWKKGKGKRPQTYFGNLQLWCTSDAREICLVGEHIHNSHLFKGVTYFIAPRNRKSGEVQVHKAVR